MSEIAGFRTTQVRVQIFAAPSAIRPILLSLFLLAFLCGIGAVSALAATGTIGNGQTVSGTLAGTGVDSYTFTANAGDAITVSISEAGPDTDFRPKIVLVRPDGSSGGGTWGNFYAKYQIKANQSGTWTVNVSHEPLHGNTPTGSYALTLVKVPGAAGQEMYPGTTYSGSITRGSVDVWTFYTLGTVGSITLNLSATGGSGFQPWAQVYRSNGTGAGGTWTSTNSTLNVTRSGITGLYTVLVSKRDDNDVTGSYNLSVTGAALPVQAKADGAVCLDGCVGGAAVGDPINVATGNLFEEVTDYTTAGANPLRLTRFYNSLSHTRSLYPALTGENWRTSFDRYLRLVSATAVAAERPDGRVVNFTLTGGAWKPDSDVDLALTNAGSTWTLTGADDTAETYTAAGGKGTLSSIRWRTGYTQTLTYTAGVLTSVTDSYGRSLGFTVTGGVLTGVTAPDALKLTYGYASVGASKLLTSVGYSTSPVTSQTYLYENVAQPFALTGITDENGARFATWTYDGTGRATSSQHAGGAGLTQVSYDDATGNRTVTNPLGLQETYRFTPLQNVPKIARIDRAAKGTVAAASRTFTYDANGYLASETDYNGNLTSYVRDARGLETSRTEASGTAQARTFATQWSAAFHRPTQVTEPGRVTSFAYDSSGNLLTRTVTAGGKSRAWTYTYNGFGQVLTINGPRTDAADVTTLTYNSKGGIATLTDALGRLTSFSQYDASGRLKRVQDPNGLVTTLAYSPRGWLTTRNAGGEIIRFAYSKAGQLTKLTRPDGSYLTYTYDGAHRLTAIRDASGNRIAYTLDKAGNVTAEKVLDASNAALWVRSHTYDAAERLAKDIGAAGQTTAYAYDANGNLTRITDPLSHVTVNAYDPLDRLVASTDPDGGVSGYAYDILDRLTGVTDPRGLATAYGYDGLDNRLSTQSPDTGATTRTFDAAGNLLTETDARGVTTTYTYDALNRPTNAGFSDGTAAIAYRYDEGTNGIGHLTGMTDPAGTTAWAYDPHGRVIQKAQLVAGKTLTTGYSYDAAGRLAGMTYPSGKVLAYGYDALGRVSGITVDGQPLLSGAVYRPFGPVEGWSAGNGGGYSRAYDTDGGVTSIQWQAGANTRSSVFTYDAARRITAISDSALPVASFDYDALDRLTSFLRGAASQDFTYDANGNRLSLAEGSATTNYQYAAGSNRLQGRSGAVTTAYTYDATGNLTGDGTRAYTYDGRGRMVKAVKGAAINQYLLNGLGQRVSKTGSGVASGRNSFVYDENGRLIGEYNASGALIKETVWLGDMPVGVLLPSATNYVYPDHLGAPWTIANQSGATVWSWNHDPFGTTAPTGSLTYNFRFPGQYFDKETGLSYNYYRDYDPTIGRYMQSDPIGLAGGINTYLYAGINPVNFIDPFGLTTIKRKVSKSQSQSLIETVNKAAQQGSSTVPLSDLLGIAGLPDDAKERIDKARGDLKLECKPAEAGKTKGRFTNEGNSLSEKIPEAPVSISIYRTVSGDLTTSESEIDLSNITGVEADVFGPFDPDIDRIRVTSGNVEITF